MSWTRLSDDFGDVTWALSDRAFRLHVAATGFCNRLLTDGLLDRSRVIGLTPSADPAEAVAELVAAGYWQEEEDGFRLLDFFPNQRSREQVLESRRGATKRKQKERHGVTVGVTDDVTDGVSHVFPGPGPGPVPLPGPGPAGAPEESPKATNRADDPWADFPDEPWGPFKHEWTARGFHLPPTERQRATLWEIVDARPLAIGQWVKEAPKGLKAAALIKHLWGRWSDAKVSAASSSRDERVGPGRAQVPPFGAAVVPGQGRGIGESPGGPRVAPEPDGAMSPASDGHPGRSTPPEEVMQ